MRVRSRFLSSAKLPSIFLTGILALLVGCGSDSDHSTPPPSPPVPLTKLSTDTFTNTSSQHATEVEPGAFAFGSTIVTAFQVGRIFGGGGTDIGFATSTDGGATWSNGFLPDITIFQGHGSFTAVSDPAVAYNAKFGLWLIASLPLGRTQAPQNIVAVSSSPDATHWNSPVQVSHTADADKDWIVCDNDTSSPNYGNCYVEWDDPSQSANDLIWMSVSNDGGQTWHAAINTGDSAHGLGGVPVVQPKTGIVIVPILQVCTTQNCTPNMLSFYSANGGASWSPTVKISSLTDHQVAGNLRSDPLPASAIDGNGNVYVVWQDCRFRANCTSNDLIMSTSADGIKWTTPARIPIDSTTSGADHFIPGLGIDPATSGATAHLGLTYYFYPTAACGTSPACELEAGFISSQNGGRTWAAPTTLTIPMSLTWLPNTFSGVMVGDYISTVFAKGKARPIFALANAPSGGLPFDEAIYTTQAPLAAERSSRRFSSAADHPVPNAHSDHRPRQFYDLEHRYPVRPPK
ncbi:MAG TPA: sialidase family protein [Terriglobales bacterium]|nr:sialidase family protein [Terriglobales bacterium]